MPESSYELFLLPLLDVVLFPGMNLPLHILEDSYKEMISKCLASTSQLGIVLLDGNICEEVGTVAKIVDVENLEEGSMTILTEGKNRFKIINFIKQEPFYQAIVEPYDDIELQITEQVKKTLNEVMKLSTKAFEIYDSVYDQELSKKIKLPEDPTELLFLIAANLTCTSEEKQAVLETQSLKVRLGRIKRLLKGEIERLEVLLENKKTKDKVIKNGKLKI
ncbi:MAG: LON peptidase substrate-binding domain-containing protein [Candidatus Melainabacteria bacterium]|nr:LON peptidase substrate-binding domain-containing protein [Candidatus Melainabacteria bacterium]